MSARTTVLVRTALVVLVTASALAVSGCTPGTTHGLRVPSTSSAHPAPAPSTTTTPAAPASTAAPSPAPLTPAGNPAGTINSYAPQTPHDSGPAADAQGTVTTNGAGVPESYTVASGDDFNHVADRLGLVPGYLFTLNMVRHSDLTLYVGDVLNLDPTHIASVGLEDGAPTAGSLPDGAPAQR